MKNINTSPARAALARNVKRLRVLAGMNQTQLARKAGVAQTAISYIENPTGKSPSLETMESVGNALKVPYWTLLICHGDAPPEDMGDAGFVLSVYMNAQKDGKQQMRRVAETESRYIQRPSQQMPQLPPPPE